MGSFFVFFDGQFWVGIATRAREDGKTDETARAIFGPEPSDAQLVEWAHSAYRTLEFLPAMTAPATPDANRESEAQAARGRPLSARRRTAQRGAIGLARRTRTAQNYGSASRDRSPSRGRSALPAKTCQAKDETSRKVTARVDPARGHSRRVAWPFAQRARNRHNTSSAGTFAKAPLRDGSSTSFCKASATVAASF